MLSDVASGQEIPLPENMPQEHPRVLTTPEGKRETWNLIKTEAWAEDVFNKLKERTEAYTRLTDVQPTWLLSRLAMYWKSHATEVYVKGEKLSIMREGRRLLILRCVIPVREEQLPLTGVLGWQM